MLENILSEMGITEDEARTYMVLLEQKDPVTAGGLARQLGMARASVYGFLARLQDKGLIRQSLSQNVKTFFPQSPEKIDQLFKNKLQKLEDTRSDLQKLLPALEKKAAFSGAVPRFAFFEGVDGVRHVLNDMLIYHDIHTVSLWPIKEMMDILAPDFFETHNRHRIQNRIHVRALWPEKRMVNVKKYPFMGEGPGFLRDIRMVPDRLDFTMGYWIYKNKIAYLSSRRESFGFIVESEEIVTTTMAQFDFIWQQSRRVKARGAETDAFLKTIYQ